MKCSGRGGAAVAVCLVVAAGAWLGPGGSARQQAPGQPFRAGVTLVTTDVVVRDGHGRFISDLTRENFTLHEDGEPQHLVSFSLVHGGRTFNLLAAPPAAAPEGIILPPPPRRPSRDGTGRLFLIFVDDMHFQAEYTPHVRQLVEAMPETLLHEGDMMAMVSSGASAIEIDLTYDRRLIASAAAKIKGSGVTAQEIFQLTIETARGVGDVRSRAERAFRTAFDFVTQLEAVRDKRKVVIFISTGYDLNPFAESRAGRDRIMGGRFAEWSRFLSDDEKNPYMSLSAVTADIELFALMRELTLTANRANATIFTIDPRGLPGVTDAGQYIDQSVWRTHLQRTQATLQYLAEQTGGFAVVNDNDVRSAFRRIDAETSDYYMLGYYSTNHDPKKRVRHIDVKVDRPGVNIFARRSYSIR